MSNIKETYQAALAERGNKAFELFETETMAKWWANFDSNESFERLAFLPKANTRLKPIAELFQLDIQRYGKWAYLMYQWRHNYDDLEDCGYKKDTHWKSPESNRDCEDLANSNNYIIERKLYANAPFNLEWAKAGLAIEINVGGFADKWISGIFQEKINYKHDNDRYLVSGEDCDSEHLRHPFPPVCSGE